MWYPLAPNNPLQCCHVSIMASQIDSLFRLKSKTSNPQYCITGPLCGESMIGGPVMWKFPRNDVTILYYFYNCSQYLFDNLLLECMTHMRALQQNHIKNLKPTCVTIYHQNVWPLSICVADNLLWKCVAIMGFFISYNVRYILTIICCKHNIIDIYDQYMSMG